MNDIISSIKNKAYGAVLKIEQRKDVIRSFSGDVRVFKTHKYVEDRNLTEYGHMLPEIEKYLCCANTVLDIGCGKGDALKEIRDKYHSNIIGTTISTSWESDFPLYNAYADSLPFEDNTFDVVLSVHGISWEPDQIQAIKEAVRVLKPGGTAHIYIIKFSHSVALFLEDNFWDGLDHSQYVENFEFTPLLEMENCCITINELAFPDEVCDGHFKEWQVLIKKNLK